MKLAVALSLLVLPAVARPGIRTLTDASTIPDPFARFEVEDLDKAPEVLKWVNAQNAATEKFLSTVNKTAIEKRLDELSQVGFLAGPAVARDRTFYSRRVGDTEQPVLLVREKDGKERQLLDPGTLEKTGKVALDWYDPSFTGKKLAYGLSRDGNEESVLHVMDVDTGKDLPDTISRTRAGSIAWLQDDSGFWYTRYPAGDHYDRHVFFHHLGSDPESDPEVFGKGRDKTDWPDLNLSHDGKHLFITVEMGWSKSEVHVLDPASGKVTLLAGADLNALFSGPEWIDGKVYVMTNYQAPRFRLVAIDPRAPNPAGWLTVIPEGDWPMDGVTFAGGRIVVTRTVKAVSHLEVWDLSGHKLSDPRLLGLGTVGVVSGDFDGHRVVFSHATFLTPGAIYELSLEGNASPRLLAAVPHMPDTKNLVVEQVDYPSYDGTLVPMFLLHRKDARPDGKNLAFLTGYGGFNISETPAFAPGALFWLERGGVWALANLRGGAEFGEAWHDAGKLGNKHQVFRDFEYAMRYLIRENWTRPDRLAISGGSNGGLLMGAMMTQAPELFRVCVGRVGLYDMLKYDRWLIGALWADEYGSASNPAQLGWLWGYSPYQQVLDGVAYPAFMGITGQSDSRVSWIHTAKFVGRLQAAQGGDAPVLFFLERRAGHGQGKGRRDKLQEDVMTWQFILSQMPGSPRTAKK